MRQAKLLGEVFITDAGPEEINITIKSFGLVRNTFNSRNILQLPVFSSEMEKCIKNDHSFVVVKCPCNPEKCIPSKEFS